MLRGKGLNSLQFLSVLLREWAEYPATAIWWTCYQVTLGSWPMSRCSLRSLRS